MTDMQRYAMTGYDSTDAWLAPDDEGKWVSHADAEAAIAAARSEAVTRMMAWVENSPVGGKTYTQGQRDMLAKCKRCSL